MIKFSHRTHAVVASALLSLPLPSNGAAAPPVTCTGVDLVAKAKRDDPQAYKKFEEAAAAVPNGKALLWKIEKPGLPASYLFGTMHSSDDEVVSIARSLAPYISQTKVIATELGEISQAVAGVKLGFRALMSRVRSDSLVTSPAARQRIEIFLRARSLDPAAALRMPPWLLMTMASFPACEIARLKEEIPIVDHIVESLGKSEGKTIVGLETIDEQADAIESVDPKLAIHMVEYMASTTSLADDAWATMRSLYTAHEPGAMLPLMDTAVALSPEDKKANDAFMVTIVERRNRTMLDRARPLLEKGGVFIAVGALHLVGPKGLVALFRQSGFTATKVW